MTSVFEKTTDAVFKVNSRGGFDGNSTESAMNTLACPKCKG
jgi:hypothetical protein